MKKVLYKLGTEIKSNTYYYVEEDITFSSSDCKKQQIGIYSRSGGQDTAISIIGKKNVVLDFNGHYLKLNGHIQPIIIKDSENVTVKNVITEYAVSEVKEMKVLAVDGKSFTAQIGQEYKMKVVDGNLIEDCDGIIKGGFNKAPFFMQSYDSKTRKGKALSLCVVGKDLEIDEKLPWAKNTFKLSVKEESGNFVFSGDKIPSFDKGDILAFSKGDRDICNIFAECSENVFITNYRIINGSGMGIVLTHVKNVYIEKLKMTYDEKSKGFLSNDADGIHAISCFGNFVIKNSIIEGMLDDAINIHSNFYTLISVNGKEAEIANIGAINSDVKVFDVGDKIRIYNGKVLEDGKDYVIKDIVKKEDKKFLFVLDKEVENFPNGSIIENITCQPKIVLKDSVIGKMNTHIRFQSRSKIVMKNVDSEVPVWFTGDTNFWYESSPCENVLIKNCNFLGNSATLAAMPEVDYSEKTKFYHEKVKVINCTFTNPECVGYFRHLKTLIFKKNKIKGDKTLNLNLEDSGEIVYNGKVDAQRTSVK